MDFCPCPRSGEEMGGEWRAEEHEDKYQHLTNIRVSISQISGPAYGAGQAFGQTLYVCSFVICCCVKVCIFVLVRAKRMILSMYLLASWWVFKEFRDTSALNNIELIENKK